jgi:uncharacterized protein
MADLAGVSFRARGDGCTFPVRVQPRARRDEVVGAQGEALKVRLTAPPVDGRANAGLVVFLAAALGVPPGSVAIVTGHTARDKVVCVAGLAPDETRRRLEAGQGR